MVRISGARGQAGADAARSGDDKSLGDLVALAAKDVSQLVRYEINLAKSELKADAKRAAMAGAFFGFAAFVACLVLVLLSFALAYGLSHAHVPGGHALYVNFLYAAVILVILAAIVAAIAALVLKRFTKMRHTRKTVTDDISMLRHAGGASPNGSRALGNGHRPALGGQGSQSSPGRPMNR